MSGNIEQAEKLQSEIEVLRSVNSKGTAPSVMKKAAEMLGFEMGPARLPVQEVSKKIEPEIKEMLQYYHLI